MILKNKARISALSLSIVMGLGTVVPAFAQGSLLHRHHKLAGAAAGYAAYRAAKKTGSNRVAHGGHRNFAQRHPILSGIGAGAVVNHMAKKHQ